MKTPLRSVFLPLLAAAAFAMPALAQPPAAPATTPAPETPEQPAAKPTSSGGRELPAFTDADSRVYFIQLKGEFGRDVNINPLRQVVADAQRFQPDILLVQIDTDFAFFGQQRQEFEQDPNVAFGQLETARSLALLFTDEIRDDADWKTRSGEKPRVIMWVKRAMGGAAFLPFIVEDIYYTPGAHHGGIGHLERSLQAGDKVVHEKMYGARLGRAEGLALKGKHDPRILRAMARTEYVLSVSFVDGKPVFYEDESGDLLLTDNPANNPAKLDSMEELLRMKGKNVLTLDADTAFKIGLSKGTVETTDDLANELGIARSFVIVPGRSEQILARWSKDVGEAERKLNSLWRDYSRISVAGATPAERNKARSQQISRLREIKTTLDRFGNAINPRKLEGFPRDAEQFDRLIGTIQEAIRRDR
jgi:hypothetical protein